jgi:dienelactone hydrolase
MAVGLFVCVSGAVGMQETLPALKEGVPPQTSGEMWAGFDPRAEPLEVEVLKEWEQDGVVLKVLRYRIGVFKGEKAMMAAVYGYPKGGKNLPGLVQIHGGGQYAHHNACLTNAKRGYATLSISWAGRIDAPGYRVSPAEVKLFWENKTDDPNYKLTTDWGAVDGYHAPSRNAGNQFPSAKAAEWTLDAMESPRNSPWFLCTLGARRALTFLEQQPEVDAGRLGVYGHSMGGKLTVLTAGSDVRVKAAAPSCGGISDRDNSSELFRKTMGDDVFLKNISCPIIFLSPANDFHGRINDLPKTVQEIKTGEWRVTCAAHHNHQDTAEYEVATPLWFDQHLKGAFAWPKTPESKLMLNTGSGIPLFSVRPDASKPILSVDVFYTQQGQVDGLKDDRENTIARFWHHAEAVQQDGAWIADLPLFSTDKPLWVYANVVYPLDQPVAGAGYYYGTYTAEQFNLSSMIHLQMPDQLQAAGAGASLEPSRMIETFEDGWQKGWFTYRPAEWGRKTHKVYHPQWAAPDGAQLALEACSPEANKLVVGIDGYAAEVELSGGSEWQTVVLSSSDFKDAAGNALPGWEGIRELRLVATEHLKARDRADKTTRRVGARWSGEPPAFRNLRWTAD